MAMEILQDADQIQNARDQLVKRGLSGLESPWRTWMRRCGLISGVPVGDRIKSWDLSRTVQFIEQEIKQSEPILDIGCFASEILVVLHRLGYSHLAGIDLNPRVDQMPYADSIRYEVSDFMHTRFPEGSFRAITAISVIEHGFQPDLLLKEVPRLLRPHGFFMASFDYWPEKMDTQETLLFGMTWTIFSARDVSDFVERASAYGLFPVGEMRYTAPNRVIPFGGKKYTFAWLVLQKRA